MLICAFCGKSIGSSPPKSFKSMGMEMMALINHQKSKHWKEISNIGFKKAEKILLEYPLSEADQ